MVKYDNGYGVGGDSIKGKGEEWGKAHDFWKQIHSTWNLVGVGVT